MDNASIDMIPVGLLIPHPDNPRKDLGDLTELAENIRANGVLQNLTVVPAPESDWNRCAPMNQLDAPHFRVVIGHRRLAAARMAGLTELPCVIADRMTPEEQIGVMLSENIQRSALTRYEEAKGFQQLQLDFGKSAKEIAELAGFHESTVRRRLKLLELDEEKFKAAETRGATLSDYMELDKIGTPKLKNKVLDKIGTPDFRNALKSALEREKNQKVLECWTAEAETFAKRAEKIDASTQEFVRNYSVYGNKKASVERPDDAGESAYFFTADSYNLSLYRAKDKRTQTEESAARAEREAARETERTRKDKLKAITERHFELRKEFVAHARITRFSAITRYASSVLIGDGRWRGGADTELLAELLGVEIDAENEDAGTIRKRLMSDLSTTVQEGRLLLCAAYANQDNSREGYWKERWNPDGRMDQCVHCDNADLDELYDLLVALGYELSEEETQMRDGTHPLFRDAFMESV